MLQGPSAQVVSQKSRLRYFNVTSNALLIEAQHTKHIFGWHSRVNHTPYRLAAWQEGMGALKFLSDRLVRLLR
jgi:hypothetical protein